MKKVTLLVATLLVLVSSIVFCGCNDGYKNLKISANVEQINLVLDDDNLSTTNIIFELSGAKSWGEINIDSKPSGLVRVEYEIKDKQCAVKVNALYPTGEGASLVITHLGSGKNASVPLNIGQKLQTVTSNGMDYIIQAPDFTEDNEEDEIKEISIPTKQLLNCEPANYTDTIVWQRKDTNTITGINVVSYDSAGNQLDQTFQAIIQDPDEVKCKGVSTAVKTVIAISKNYDINTTIVLNPISILDGEAILHKDVEVEVSIVDLLELNDIKITSDTHGRNSYVEDGITIDNNELKDLVLINNPDPANPREVAGLSGYDFYSTAIIDLKLEVPNPVQAEGASPTILQTLSGFNPKFKDLYNIQISTTIDALRLENVEFDKFRVIATSTCVGEGTIKIDFVPKDCVGDIKAFSVSVPCIVGERATSFKATNNNEDITINKVNDYNFSSTTPLRDSNSLGQAFKFEMLSTNTLNAFKSYRITINKNLLYINPSIVEDDNTSMYIKNSAGTNLDLTDLLSSNNRFEDQISILKDSRQITFYESVDGENFVSEPLTSRQTIYMKWVRTIGKELGGADEFGITISNYYDESYDIKDNKFNETVLNYKLSFNRQRSVEKISYVPVKIIVSGGLELQIPNDAGSDWQFYFEPTMLEGKDNIYYGFQILEVLGLNSAQLTEAELSDIDLRIAINNDNLGFSIFDYTRYEVKTPYSNEYIFNFDSGDVGYENIIVVGKLSDIGYGDYAIEIRQGVNTISSRNVTIYKQLEEDDVSVSIPNAEFEGGLLQYQYVSMTAKPEYWDTEYVNYYEYIGGQYVKANATWSASKSYYKSIASYDEILGDYFTLSDNSKMKLNDTYVLAASDQYNVNVIIDNKDFINLNGQTVAKHVVATSGEVLNNNIITTDSEGNVITTMALGSFNAQTNQQNFIKLTYTIKSNTYSYYKINTEETSNITKTIYIYVYEPLTLATFDNTMLYKYNYSSIPNSQFKEEYGKQTLSVELNDNSETILNYVNIKWTYSDDGISDFILNSADSATFTFANNNYDRNITGRIIAILTQFGVQYPIYCNYSVSRPILTDQVVLNTTINSFASGEGYINLKVGESIQLDVSSRSYMLDRDGNPKPVSLPGFSYIVCSTTGYAIDRVASIDEDGLLTATSAGRAKLIILAKDRIKNVMDNITNYFNVRQYLENDAYLIIDIMVSDGSEAYPFLIATGNDFKKIANDYYYIEVINGSPTRVNAGGDTSKINDYHYALVSDIDLNGQVVNFKNFEGTISSFQENVNSNNRFRIYGVMLNESNPNLFTTLNANDNDLAVLKNIDLHVDINYLSTGADKDILLGLIGTNEALIDNITITISGQINANNLKNNYTIGSMVALNTGVINIDNPNLVGVQGNIRVNNSALANVILGGLVGENRGLIKGANITSSISSYVEDDLGDYVFDETQGKFVEYVEAEHTGLQRYKFTGNDVEYEVYYDNQGATADIDLRVTNVDNSRLTESAIGGIVGYNNLGLINNVYAMGRVFGTDNANNLSVNNIGGLIGKNIGNETIDKTIKSHPVDDHSALESLTFSEGAIFQINNSYSSVIVKGNDNVGGAVGYDEKGSYKKVYYEMYTTQESVKGNANVGGLIGYTKDSNLYYCYANNFAWGYKSSVEVYDIVGNTNVGGLIGLAESSRTTGFTQTLSGSAMNIVSSLASATLNGAYNVSGIIGRLNNFGALYTAYFHGVINPNISITNLNPITKMYIDNSAVENIPYNNVYAIVNGESKVDNTFYLGNGFNVNNEYNNGKPYIVYGFESNLVSIIPTKIEVNKAFEQDNLGTTEVEGYYNPKNNAMYKQNSLGDYVFNGTSYIPYDDNTHRGWTRFSLMAEVKPTGDIAGTNSDYRANVIVLYYYQFTDMSGENALNDLYDLNTINMHDLVADRGIIVLPTTLKRFNLRTSNNGVVSVLSGGKLLLNSEGQAVVTIVSTLNPSVSASFVVIVRTKVLEFNLYSSANLREEYNLSNPNNSTISIVKGSSKIIYADYSSIIQVYGREYAYRTATNMQVKFSITYNGTGTLPAGKTIKDYITLNGTYYDEDDDTYTIPYGTPITITVKDYIDGTFTITAIPYVVATYNNGGITTNIPVKLSDYFETSFNVATKKGASAVNINKTQIDMMSADDPSKLDVKVTTDVIVDKLYFEVEALGDKWETNDPKNPTADPIQFVDMIDIVHTNQQQYDNDEKNYYFDISSDAFSEKDKLQTLQLTLDLNDLSHYVEESFRLQVTLYVLSTDGRRISTTLYINVRPQAITSVIPLNYRMTDGAGELDIENTYQSQVIRPGSTNIITIDIAPSIAVYDYIEIIDTTTQDKILLQQVDENLNLPEYMDAWTANGIKLRKYNSTDKYNALVSKLYVLARLPQKATANITHTLNITVYSKSGNALYTTYLNLEAVMYPTVVMTYTDPSGQVVATADTRDGNSQQEVLVRNVNLAMGVQAELGVTTYNIDEGTLKHSVTISKGGNDYTDDYGNMVSLEYRYGKYILEFNSEMEQDWEGALLGSQISVSFTASKSLNGIKETCKATIEFTIRRMVIHSVSMTRTTTSGKIHGNWDENFETYFYFDHTDISYYYDGYYWNTQYTIDETNPDGFTGQLKDDITVIHNILKELNKWHTEAGSPIKLYLASLDETDKTQLTADYKNNDESISIENSKNKFIINAKTGSNINNLKLMVEFELNYDNYSHYPVLAFGGDYDISNSFGFDVTKPTNPFDEYILVHNQQEFEAMIEGEFYQLAKDITLTNYTPLNVAIGGLNGDGYTITFAKGVDTETNQVHEAFNIAQLILDYTSGGMYIGLFGTLATDTIVQNLQVHYETVSINLNDSTAIQDQHTNDIYFGGIAGINLGVITNVRVSGSFELISQYIGANHIDMGGISGANGTSDSTKVATITGSTVELEMTAMALIGGVSGTNYGKITNTGFKGLIKSKSTNQYVAEVTTAGFVVENRNGAYISLSYVDCATTGDYDIDSVGRTAGFVLNNAGTINNCYIAKTSISSQGNIGGFVYQSGGDISNSYAYASLGNSLFYNEFIYTTSNIGTLTNCYMISDSTINLYISGLTKLETAKLAQQENYIGFIFAKSSNGVWSISSDGPQLLNSGFNSNRREYNDICNIYNVETYQEYFTRNSYNDIIEGKTFRLVRDIDFASEGFEDNPITFNKTLKASFEGNDMALINYNIYKTSDINSIGLFANIGTLGLGTYVRNLILQPASIKATGSNSVGALAGVIDSVNVYNIIIDNTDLLILGKNAVGGLAGIIKGNFEVIGINSNVSVFATYTHSSGEQYNLYTGKNVLGNILIDNIDKVSYAGAVAGIVDGYNTANPVGVRTINSYYSLSNIVIDGALVIIGETVGGAFGLVGERTLVKNLNYNLSDSTIYQGVYVSGGLVGENRGIIQSSNIYAYTYVNGTKQEVNTSTCFDNFARVNGAIVGVNIGGLINNCTSDIDVCTTKALSTAGGIVGRNIRGSVYDCEVSSKIVAYFAGGIVGTDYSYNTIIKQNSGYGTATHDTIEVYNHIQTNISYNSNCLVNNKTHNKDELYSGNVFTSKFITNFIKQKGQYYTYNLDYINGISNDLVSSVSIFGLAVGLTDGTYNTNILLNDGQFSVDLTLVPSHPTRPRYEIENNGNTAIIEPIANIVADLDIYDFKQISFVYIIAYDKGSYEFWSSSLGYTNEYIAISKEALTPYVAE